LAEAAITRDVKNGIEALGKIIDVTDKVEKKDVKFVDLSVDGILRRLTKIGTYQVLDRTELQFRLNVKRQEPKLGSFSKKGIEVLRELGKAELNVERVTLYGKLKRLTDFNDDDEGKYFWGELREDNGSDWRIRFPITELKRVQHLFTRQVIVTGDATYFRTKSPRIDAQDIDEEKPRDYVAAFTRFRQQYSGVFGDEDPESLLNDIRG
jgi:hypothetical protein